MFSNPTPPSKRDVEELQAHGYERKKVLQALLKTHGNPQKALEHLRRYEGPGNSTVLAAEPTTIQAELVAVPAEPLLGVSASIAPGMTLSDKLTQLNEAARNGLLTDAEYQEARAAALSGMSGTGQPTVVSAQPGAALNDTPRSKCEGPMILTPSREGGADMRLRIEDVEGLKAGRTVPLRLASHPGKGIGKMYPHEKRFQEWRYIESQVCHAEAAIQVKLEGDFLKLASNDLVLDVSFWKFEEGNTVNFVGGNSTERTYLGGGGRDWVVNDDGTIALKHHRHLYLGTHPPPGLWTSNDRRMDTKEIEGLWACCCPIGGWAIFHKESVDIDVIMHRGMVCLCYAIPLPFEEKRRRVPNTNGFYKDNPGDVDRNNVDVYTSSSYVCNGIACSTKLR